MPAGPPAFDPKSNSVARRFFLLARPPLRKGAMSVPRVRASITALAWFSLVTLVGCELPIRPRDGSAVVQIRVVPESVALDPAQTQPFVASGRTAAGDSMAVDVTWTTSAGTITPAGVYTADTGAADVIVTATLVGSQISGVAHVRKRRVAPQAGHVFLVTEENHDYSAVIGSSSMPYLNSLAQQYGLATQYYANTHPSIGNYFELATGQIITNNDSYSTIVTVDNIVRQLLAAGKTWKSYAEDLPSVGFTGATSGGYARKHNVFALLSDVVNDAAQVQNLVPVTQFATDLANGTLPDFVNIVPNLCNDAHDCSLATADAWLQSNIDPLIKSALFQQDGLLIITFDESSGDNSNGGGRIVWVAVSPKAKRGYQSATLYQHQSTLRLILKGLGVTAFPGAAASAPDMSEFFTP